MAREAGTPEHDCNECTELKHAHLLRGQVVPERQGDLGDISELKKLRWLREKVSVACFFSPKTEAYLPLGIFDGVPGV